jgi:hypothetical protein
MRDLIEKSLSTKIEVGILKALLDAYQKMVLEKRIGGRDESLTQAGKFVEHTLRAIQFIRTGITLSEIKRPAELVKEISKDETIPESLRALIPAIAYSMIYEVRSKRGAVHVKEIDPREIDVVLSVQAASWIIAELVRLYHVADEASVADAMASLMRAELPFVETIGGEVVVTAKVSCPVEILLLIARTSPVGIARRQLGLSSRNTATTISKTLQRLNTEKLIHQTADGLFHITGPGERHLSRQVAEMGGIA